MIKGFVVHLDESIKDEDAAHIRSAIQMIKNVRDVTEVEDDVSQQINREKCKHEIIYTLINSIRKM